MARSIGLVTATEMPKPDPETWRVVDELRALGFDVATPAWTDDADWAGFDLVVCRTPWDYVHRAPAFAAWATQVASVTRFENPVEVITWNIHKRYLVELADRGVATVPTRLVTAADAATEVLGAFGTGEVVVKPAVSVGAIDTLRAAADAPGTRRHLEALTSTGDVLVQPFHDAVLDGEVSVVLFDGVFSHAVRKVPADGDYRVQDHYGGVVHRHDPSAAELALADAALAAAPMATAYARVDMVGGPHAPQLMELEVIEPELFLAAEGAAARFAAVLAERVDR